MFEDFPCLCCNRLKMTLMLFMLIHRDMYQYTSTYFPWSSVGLGVSAVMLAYFVGLIVSTVSCSCLYQYVCVGERERQLKKE